MGPRWQTSQFIETLILNVQAKWHTQRCLNSSKVLWKDQGVGGSPIVGVILPLIRIWNHPGRKKTSHTTLHGCCIYPLWWDTLCGLCLSLNPNNLPLTYHCVSHWTFLQWDIKNLSFIRSWNEVPWILTRIKSQSDKTEWLSIAQCPCHMGLSPNLGEQFQAQFLEMERWWPAQYFVNSGIDGEKRWRMGGKNNGKNIRRNPFHNLSENSVNTWPVPTIIIGLILRTKEVKERRTLTFLDSSY